MGITLRKDSKISGRISIKRLGGGLVRPDRTFSAEDTAGGPCSRSQQKGVVKPLLLFPLNGPDDLIEALKEAGSVFLFEGSRAPRDRTEFAQV